MQRPIMDPTYVREADVGARAPSVAWLVVRGLGRALRRVGRLMLTRPLRRRRHGDIRGDDTDRATLALRVTRAVAARLAFAPLLLALVSAALVYAGTHPPQHEADADSLAAVDVYHEPVDLAAADGTSLRGWLAPAVDARRVLTHRDRLLRQRRAAVVLVHDFGRGPGQMLPLLGPLHDDGFVVLAIGCRGQGTGTVVGQTFGLNESLDVAAAVAALRARPGVDGRRVGVVGIGTGATAAVLAAARDAGIAAVLLVSPPDDAIARVAGPDIIGLGWLRTVNRWTFQIAYSVDADELHPAAWAPSLAARPVLQLDGPATDVDGRLTAALVGRAREFCRATLQTVGPDLSYGSVE